MLPIEELLRVDINEQFIRKSDFKSVSNDNVARFFYHISQLIAVPLVEHQVVTFGVEQNKEINTFIMVRDLLYLLGIDNPKQSKLSLKYLHISFK